MGRTAGKERGKCFWRWGLNKQGGFVARGKIDASFRSGTTRCVGWFIIWFLKYWAKWKLNFFKIDEPHLP